MDPSFCNTRFLRIAYRAAGPLDGAPVLLLHGWPDDASTWDAIVPALHASGYRTFAPWLRGFGPTRFLRGDTLRSGEIAAMAQDALDFMDAQGVDRFAVVGHDWGARIAYLLAATQPQRLRCCAALSLDWQPGALPTPDLEQAQAFWYQWFMATRRGADVLRAQGRAFARRMWETWSPSGWFDDAGFDAVAASFDNPDWVEVTLHSYRVRWEQADPDPQHADLARRAREATGIQVPVLAIHGAADRCILPPRGEGGAAYFRAGHQRRMLAGVGHFPTREAPQLVAQWLVDFLDQGR